MLWCVSAKPRITVWKSAVKMSKYFGPSRQANPFYPLGKTTILEEKCFIPAHFFATGNWRNQQPIHCKVPQEAWVRKVNEPTFSIILVGVFMGEKLITCDKYNGAWTSCHFCQAACEQKHFCNVVILAMDLPNQCPMQKPMSTHTRKVHKQSYVYTGWQNMTAHKKCKVHKLWHWWHAVSWVKHCALSAIMPPLSRGTAMWNDRHISF